MDEKFVVKAVAAVVCVFFVTVSGCTIHRDALYYEAVKDGADPMALSCAKGIGEKEIHICTIIAQRGEVK